MHGSILKVKYHKCVKNVDSKNKTTMKIYEIEKILRGEEDISNYRLKNEKGDDDMRFQIIDNNGNVVDEDLSYESALMYIDSVIGKHYIMLPMKEED